MLTGVHFLLTYQCTYECDHCFVFGSPTAEGTFTMEQVRAVLDQAQRVGSINRVYFEGGEAFLYYPLLIESLREARRCGFEVGIVTNAYFATTEQDAELWFAPLREIGIADLSISDDAFHSSKEDNPAKRALSAAREMGLPAASICVEKPAILQDAAYGTKGSPVVGGGVMFRGRAAERLTGGLPTLPWESFTECPHEELADPERVHVDSFGNVHLCQGLTVGNLWQTPLSALVREYAPAAHPIAGPLLRGGPAQLVKELRVPHAEGYVDACHLCYSARKQLLDRFPSYSSPRRLYGA